MIPRVHVRSRRAWGGTPPTGSLRRHRIERITIHESGHLVRDAVETLENLPAYEADHRGRGWGDLAYHFAIDIEGTVYRGRAASAQGETATEYDPRGHLLVMCDGAFRWQSPNAEQLRSLVALSAWACARYGVPPSRIASHRDFAAIPCPGARLHRFVDSGRLRRGVERALRAGDGSLRI